MATQPTSSIPELSLFDPPDPSLDVLSWPCIVLTNVCVYAEASTTEIADVTETENEDDVGSFTVEGDVEQVVTESEPVITASWSSLYADKDPRGARIRISNATTVVLRKSESEGAEDDVDFQILGEACWYKCASPSPAYTDVYNEIIEKTRFWNWIVDQVSDISPQESTPTTLFDQLNTYYREDFKQAKFFGLLKKHDRFIISRLLKDKYWEDSLLLAAFGLSDEYGAAFDELAMKLKDGDVQEIVDESAKGDDDLEIKSEPSAHKKRKRENDDDDDEETDIKKEEYSTVSDLLSHLSDHKSENIFKAAAHVLSLYGPKSSGLVIVDPPSSEFLETVKQFLEDELLFTDEMWHELVDKASNLRVFCGHLREILELLESNRESILDSEEYAAYTSYLTRLKAVFESRLPKQKDKNAEESTEEEDEIIITNEQEDEQEIRPTRKSQKAVSKLRPFGSPTPFASLDFVEDDLEESATSIFGSADAGRENGLLLTEEKEIADADEKEGSADDGMRLKKSADEAMFRAVTENIQRRLQTFFRLKPLSKAALAKVKPQPWSCPQDDCTMNLDNCNTPEARDIIQRHYEAHAARHLAAMEAMRFIGSGKHVERLLAKIDGTTALWAREQTKLNAVVD
ncbi:hypothetical protein BZA70DRAFT_285286 [Myxozyma melibiosi]|uniref:RFTS domain-containing protein n=1 Tax=Myxozyma melibiosi TaxID=54550 RepID=A0ABR1F069_9ASCO